MSSAYQIDQLGALRFKAQMGSKTLSREKSEEISENEIPGMWEEIAYRETYNKYGDSAMKIEISEIGGDWYLFANSICGNTLCEILNRWGIFLRRGGINRFRLVTRKRTLTSMKIENAAPGYA